VNLVDLLTSTAVDAAPCIEWLSADQEIEDVKRLDEAITRNAIPLWGWSDQSESTNTYRVHGFDSLNIGRVTWWTGPKRDFQDSRDFFLTAIEFKCARHLSSSSPAFAALAARLLANLQASAIIEDAESQPVEHQARYAIEPTPMNAIREALAAEDYYGARALAEQAHREHPDDPELATAARVLAPPRVLRADLPPDPGIRANMDWMEREAANYPGQWVAVKDGVLVASAPSVSALKERVPDLRGHFVVKVY
jgi:hypothetical protein